MKDFLQYYFYSFLDWCCTISVLWELLFYGIVLLAILEIFSQVCLS